MTTRDLTSSAILLAIGTLLHLVMPGIVGGMKPDFLLLTMFLAILMNLNLKNALVVSALAGILAALTTTFPGGQVPSIIDKLLSGLFMYLAANFIDKKFKLNNPNVIAIGFLGTLISGAAFIFFALLIAGLPEGLTFTAMFLTVVLPTAILTGFLAGFFNSLLGSIKKLRG